MFIFPVRPESEMTIFIQIHSSAVETLIDLHSIRTQGFVPPKEGSLTVKASAQYSMTVDGPVSFENSLAHWFTHALKFSLPYYFDSLSFITSCQRVSLSYPNEMASLVRQLSISLLSILVEKGRFKR
jgi:hypothetical protein